jgi:hypothetical protein
LFQSGPIATSRGSMLSSQMRWRSSRGSCGKRWKELIDVRAHVCRCRVWGGRGFSVGLRKKLKLKIAISPSLGGDVTASRQLSVDRLGTRVFSFEFLPTSSKLVMERAGMAAQDIDRHQTPGEDRGLVLVRIATRWLVGPNENLEIHWVLWFCRVLRVSPNGAAPCLGSCGRAPELQ